MPSCDGMTGTHPEIHGHAITSGMTCAQNSWHVHIGSLKSLLKTCLSALQSRDQVAGKHQPCEIAAATSIELSLYKRMQQQLTPDHALPAAMAVTSARGTSVLFKDFITARSCHQTHKTPSDLPSMCWCQPKISSLYTIGLCVSLYMCLYTIDSALRCGCAGPIEFQRVLLPCISLQAGTRSRLGYC